MRLSKTFFTIVLSLSFVVAIRETRAEVAFNKRARTTSSVSSEPGVLKKRVPVGGRPNPVTCDNGVVFDMNDCLKAATCLANKAAYPGSDMMIAGQCLVMTYNIHTGQPYVTKTWSASAMRYFAQSAWDPSICVPKYQEAPRTKGFKEMSDYEAENISLTADAVGDSGKLGKVDDRSCEVPDEETRQFALSRTVDVRQPH